jgi:hypothetical protein
MFSSADLHGKCARINLSPFGMILQNHRRLPVSIFIVKIAALGSGFSKLLSNFKGAS